MAKWLFGLPLMALEGVIGDPEELKGPFQRPLGTLVQNVGFFIESIQKGL